MARPRTDFLPDEEEFIRKSRDDGLSFDRIALELSIKRGANLVSLSASQRRARMVSRETIRRFLNA